MIGLLAPLALVAAQVAAQPAAPVYPQSGAIGIVPPPGMVEAALYAGFEDPETRASIVLAELPPVAFAELAAKIDSAAGSPLPNGVELSGKGEPVTLPGGEKALLYRGGQTVAGEKIAKWLLLVDGKQATALVTAQVFEPASAGARASIESALRTVRLRGPAELETAIAALPFTIGDRAGFRAVRPLMGSALLLTDGPLDVDTDGAQPLVIVAGSFGAVPVADRAGYARKLLDTTQDLTRIAVTSATASPDGAVHTIAATAVDRARVINVRQYIRFVDGGGYLRIMCLSPVAEDVAARCDRLAASARPRVP